MLNNDNTYTQILPSYIKHTTESHRHFPYEIINQSINTLLDALIGAGFQIRFRDYRFSFILIFLLIFNASAVSIPSFNAVESGGNSLERR